jgi:hypothetical protein
MGILCIIIAALGIIVAVLERLERKRLQADRDALAKALALQSRDRGEA